MDDRLMTLETKSAYQEHLIQELNEVVISQQQQIDRLEKNFARLKDDMSSNETQPSTVENEAPPPHY